MHIGELFILLIVIWTPYILCDRWDDQETRRFAEEYISQLQLNLRRADDNSDENYITSKSITKNNRRYDVHLIKLRNVNGLKRHNLIVKEISDDNPLIYVINPVETKIPHAYVSQTEFKDILNNRIKKQRHEVYKKVDPLLPLMTVNSTYWTKIMWSKPIRRATSSSYHNFFKHKNVSKIKHINPTIPYIRNRNRESKVHKTNILRSNKIRKAKTVKAQYLRSSKTSKVKTVKPQHLRSYITSKAINNKDNTSKNDEKSNKSISTKRSKKELPNLSLRQIDQIPSQFFKNYQNFNINEETSKANILDKIINETNDRPPKEITTEKSTTKNELPTTKNEVAGATEVFTTKMQSTEEVSLAKPTNSDITTEKRMPDEETKIELSKTVKENTENSKNEGETTEILTDLEITTIKLKADDEIKVELSKTVIENTEDTIKEKETTKIPTHSEITTEKLTTEDKTTKEPSNTETGNTEHSKEEETAETPATEDTTKSNDTVKTINNSTESVYSEDLQVDLATDQIKVEETTVRKLPFRTTVKRTTTKARKKTTRTRLLRPLVFMGETGNGNSWNQ